jgi:hypothetical protein
VYKGAAKPLTRPRRICPEIHGASGLDGPDIPPAPRDASAEKAVNALAHVVRSHALRRQLRAGTGGAPQGSSGDKGDEDTVQVVATVGGCTRLIQFTRSA